METLRVCAARNHGGCFPAAAAGAWQVKLDLPACSATYDGQVCLPVVVVVVVVVPCNAVQPVRVGA